MIDDLIAEGLEHAFKKAGEKEYNKSIYEGKYGRKPFVDSLSGLQAHKDHSNRTIKELNEVF